MNHLFQTVNYTILSQRLPKEFDGYRIVHLSDLHGAVYGEKNKLLIKKIHDASPHMVVMTGDMADDTNHSMAVTEHLCGCLSKHYPIYYIPGNHEQSMKQEIFRGFIKKLNAFGVTVLENRWCTISRNGGFVKLYGLVMAMKYYNDPLKKGWRKGIHFSEEDAKRILGPSDRDCYNILLSHNPLYYPSLRDWGADLTLSGHIHGGIIRIPGFGGLLSPDVTLFPKYDGGHFRENGKDLIVSRGLGNHFLVRIRNPEELVVVTLKSL